MGYKIFVSYKYHDSNVRPLGFPFGGSLLTTVRSYVDAMEKYFDKTDYINKAESSDEDLSMYSEDTIWNKLRDRIFDSSVTIVIISPGMRDFRRSDKSQWIPWEISFSLKETTRSDRTSHVNAILAVVLPDRNGSYDYFVTSKTCCSSSCTIYNTESLFQILRNNMFNKKEKNRLNCLYSQVVYQGEVSYIKPVRWDDFITRPDDYIEAAVKIKNNADDYEIKKEV